MLNGTIKTEGKASKYYFEFAESGAAGTKRCEGTVTAAEAPVECPVGELAAGHSFLHVPLDRVHRNHRVHRGRAGDFETSPAVTGVTTESATGISGSGATLTGPLRPQGIETQYRFEYGEPANGNVVFGKQAPLPYGKTNSGGIVPISTPITNLSPDREYDYRLVAFNQFGTTFGPTLSFRTTGPTITPQPTEEGLTHTSATVNALISPDKVAKSKYKVEFGETTGYGARPRKKNLRNSKNRKIKEELKGLKVATAYHFRFVVETKAARSTGLTRRLRPR